MFLVPRPDNPTAVWGCQYDAWNRLVRVINVAMAQDVARYEYDGLNRRVVKNVFDGGSLDHRLHFYYNESWQLLEVRREEDSTESEDPVEQFVWHPYYIDALATRFWDAAADGQSIEQHYFTHDANFNVTAALDDSGDAVERYHYSPYGEVTFLDDVFDPIAESDIDNWHLYTGRERDPETGLQLNRNRYYHPSLGRWISRDPIGYEGSEWNLYEYVTSMPTIEVDSAGLSIWVLPLRPTPIICRPGVGGSGGIGRPGPRTPVPLNPPRWDPEPAPQQPEPMDPSGPEPPGECMDPPGDCTEGEHRRLQRRVNQECRNPPPGACTSRLAIFWQCDTLRDRANHWERCAAARLDLNQTCFRGGDRGHIHAQQMAQWHASYCFWRVRTLFPDGCDGDWIPPYNS